MKILHVFLLLLFAPLSAQTFPFQDLINPGSIAVRDRRLFIADGIHLYVIALNGMKLEYRIGKEGTGPGELRVVPKTSIDFSILNENILINSRNKVSFFSKKNGRFVREIPVGMGIPIFQPLGDKYVGSSLENDGKSLYFTLNIYDEGFKKEREIFRQLNPYQGAEKKFNPFLQDSFRYWCHFNKIFLKDAQDGIHIFSMTGDRLKSFKCNFRRLPVRDIERNDVYHQFMTDPRVRQFFESFKKLIQFPDYLPEIRDLYVSGRDVYVVSYETENEKSVCYVYSPAGVMAGRILLPLKQKSILAFSPYAIEDGKLYQLVENRDGDWELAVSELGKIERKL